MSIELIDKIKPKNGGSFPMADAEDILMPDGQRLDDFWRNPDVVLEGQTVSGFIDGGTWWGYGSADAICPNLVAGVKYRVNWDGTEYVCTAVDGGTGMVYVGDPGIAMDEGSGAYPFQIRTDAEPTGGSNRFTCLTTDEGESHEIAIYRGENAGKPAAYPVTEGVAEIEPEKYYDFGEVSTLAVTLAETDDDLAHEYCFEFVPTAGFEGLSITPEPKWACDPQYPAGKTCQVSILRGVAVMACA